MIGRGLASYMTTAVLYSTEYLPVLVSCAPARLDSTRRATAGKRVATLNGRPLGTQNSWQQLLWPAPRAPTPFLPNFPSTTVNSDHSPSSLQQSSSQLRPRSEPSPTLRKSPAPSPLLPPPPARCSSFTATAAAATAAAAATRPLAPSRLHHCGSRPLTRSSLPN